MSSYLETIGLDLDSTTDAGRLRHDVLSAAAWSPTPTTSVSYSASNKVLVIGSLEEGRAVEQHLGDDFLCYLAVRGDHDAVLPVSNAWQVGQMVLEGYLGKFRLMLPDSGETGPASLGELMGITDGCFDHVVDLGEQSCLVAAIKPPGYYFAGPGAADLQQVLKELPELRGEFEKPRFFHYNPDICAHSRSGIAGCNRCLEACPTDAIISIGERIEVNPHLCQGGGSCASSCPSGAITYRYPPAEEQIDFLRQIIRDLRSGCGNRGISLLIYDNEHGNDAVSGSADQLPGHVIPMAVEEVGSAGPELLAAALAYGCTALYILVPDTVAESVRGSLQRDVQFLQQVLSELGLGNYQLQLINDLQLVLADSESTLVVNNAATFAGIGNKRSILRSALLHMHHMAGYPREVLPLSEGSIFGQVKLTTEACTLCMGCVSVCPGNALEAGGETPALRFIEANCLQCGICTRACPESALTLETRFNTADSARRALTLKEEEPFRCISCNKPFATVAMINRVTEKLAGHWMFESPEKFNRLRMCEDCRVVDMFDNKEQLN